MMRAYICDGARTPIGRYGGALSGIRADDLAAIPIKALIDRNPSLDLQALDDVVLGCANQSGEDNRNVARMAGLLSGLPVGVPGTTINRLCGSGLDAIAYAARSIAAGEADLIIAGGVESMSRAPFVMGKADRAFGRSHQLEDTTMGWRFVNRAMADRYGVDTMPQTAENVAREFAVTREDQDRFALRSQERAALAQRNGTLAREICPVTLADGAIIDVDEHPRETSLDALARLRPVVRPDGTITAGNASGINDGAAAVIVASEAAVRRHGLKPRARVVASAVAGVAPRVMGLGPIPAVAKLLGRTGVALGDVDRIELNEAFAAQALAVLRSIGIDDRSDIVNPHGGAIALGHPLGMSGARLVHSCAVDIAEGGSGMALVTMCIGVGQGIAMLLAMPH